MQNSDEYLQPPGIGTTGRKKKKNAARPTHPSPASVIILKMLPKQLVLAAVAQQQSHGGVQPGTCKAGRVLSAECEPSE